MKKTIRRIVPAMLVLVALGTLSFMAKDGVTLRLKPQQGKAYTITNKANMMMNMEVQGQMMNQTQTIETRQTFTAKEVSDSRSVIETQIEAIKMTISQMGMKLEYDSEHPEKTSPMLAGQTSEFDANIKKPSTVTYDAMGNAIDSLEFEMSQLGGVIVELPKEALSVGSTWNVDKKQNISGTEMNAKMTYTVTAISKKSVDVSVNGTVEGLVEGSNISGSYTGTASFNPQQGFITKSNIKSNISMTISQQGLTIPTTMVGTTNVEVK